MPENGLERGVHQLEEMSIKYNLKIPMPKTKIMAFPGLEPIRGKIVLDNISIRADKPFYEFRRPYLQWLQ